MGGEPRLEDDGRGRAAEQWARLAPLIAQAPYMRLSPDGGANFPGGIHERRLSPLRPALPDRPAAVPVYDRTGHGRLLVADFDVSRARALGAADPAALVAEQAAALAALVEACGGRAACDRSPSGGRHVYVMWSRPQPWTELRDLARALARRFPTIDVQPMSNPKGQIRPPGAPHKTRDGHLTGYLLLTGPLTTAEQALRRGNGPSVWARLVEELTAEYDAVQPPITAPATHAPDATTTAPLDDQGTPWLPRLGGRRSLPPRMADLARTGNYRAAGYPSASEARYALCNSAAAAGWHLADLARTPGMAALLASRRPADRAARLAADWSKAITTAGRKEPARNSHTSENTPHPPTSQNPAGLLPLTPVRHERPLTEHQFIRTWSNAVWCAEHDAERLARWGRAAPAVRMLLRAIGAAASMSGAAAPAFGVRELGLLAGLDYSTAAAHLRMLRDEADPLLDLVEQGRGLAADRYQLRIPDAYRHDALWRRWKAGRIEVMHPALRALGGPVTALVYETLSTVETGAAELTRLALLSGTATGDALARLAAHGLAERGPHGWRRGPADLTAVAVELGADLEAVELRELYRQQRQTWRALVASWHLPPASRPGFDVDQASTELIPWPTAPAPGHHDDDQGDGWEAAERALNAHRQIRGASGGTLHPIGPVPAACGPPGVPEPAPAVAV